MRAFSGGVSDSSSSRFSSRRARGVRIAALLDEAGERPRRVGVVRAQREHALVGGARGGGVADARLQHVAGGHQRRDPRRRRRVALLGLAQLRVGERARIVVGRGDARRARRAPSGARARAASAWSIAARAPVAIVEPLEPAAARAGCDSAGQLAARHAVASVSPASGRGAVSAAMRPSRIAAASRSRPALTQRGRPAGRRAPDRRARSCARGAARRPLPRATSSQSSSTCARRASSCARSAGSRVERGAPAQHVGELGPPRAARRTARRARPTRRCRRATSRRSGCTPRSRARAARARSRRSARSSAARRAPPACPRRSRRRARASRSPSTTGRPTP